MVINDPPFAKKMVALNPLYFLFPLVKTPTNPPDAPGTCEEGWTAYGSSCYQYNNGEDVTSWPEAEFYCTKQGGYVASVHSKQENEWIRTILAGDTTEDIWIGLHRTDSGKSLRIFFRGVKSLLSVDFLFFVTFVKSKFKLFHFIFSPYFAFFPDVLLFSSFSCLLPPTVVKQFEKWREPDRLVRQRCNQRLHGQGGV